MGILGFLQRRQRYRKAWLDIGGRAAVAILADSAIKRMIGLMFRAGLRSDECMLFVFPRTGHHSIWMYNMRFPIDVAWLDGDMRVVDTFEGMRPCRSLSGCETYSPKRPALYVLEGAAGFMRRYRIRKGSRIRFAKQK